MPTLYTTYTHYIKLGRGNECLLERQMVNVDKVISIENDANRYAIETVGNPAYPMKLNFGRFASLCGTK